MDRFNRWGLMNSLIAILNEGNDSTDVFIAKYFMKNFGRMQDLNVYDVAQECFVDRATIRRFAQKLGYANFKEMKEQFENYNDYYKFYRADIIGDGEPMAQQISAMANDIDQQFEEQALEKILDEIHDCGDLIFLTSDIYSNQGIDFQKTMIMAGKMVRIVSNVYENHIVLKNLNPNDLLVVLSVSGFFARESLDFVSKLNVRKILITTLRADKFEEEYDDVYYLSKDFHKETRSIYALFGLKYFLEKISLAYINRFVRPN